MNLAKLKISFCPPFNKSKVFYLNTTSKQRYDAISVIPPTFLGRNLFKYVVPLIVMIYEPKTEMHYSLWVDGFLPSKKTLVNVLSEKARLIYNNNPNDTTLMEDFENRMTAIYSQIPNGKTTHTCTYVHLLKPCYSHSLPGSSNPIKDEWIGLDNHKDYRLLVMLKNTDDASNNEIQSMKSTFLKTVEAFNIIIKPHQSYNDLMKFKDYLRHFSKYLLGMYFFPFQSIRDGIRILGFDSEDAMV